MQTLNDHRNRPFNQVSRQRRIKKSPFQGWFYLTSIPDPPEGASFVKRETARKSRLISVVACFLLLLFAICLPAAIIVRNVPSLVSTSAILPVTLVAILLNRAGKTFAAGIIIVCASEILLSLVILTTRPFDVMDMQSYELLVIGELLSVSLLPGRSVFIVALYNSAVILGSLLYQPKTPALLQIVHHQLVAVVLNPVGVQLLVAGVTYLWVSSTLRAIARADYAEVVAALEQEIGREATLAAEEKHLLEAKINEIVKFHNDAMKSSISAKFPFSEETKVLWPLINVIHSLQRKVQSSFSTDSELRRLKNAIADYTSFVYKNDLTQRKQWPQTKTDLDLLLYAIMQQMGKRSEFVSHPTIPLTPAANTGTSARTTRKF